MPSRPHSTRAPSTRPSSARSSGAATSRPAASDLPRREFLRATSAAAAIGALGGLAQAADEKPASKGPGEKIVVGVMGVNSRGAGLANVFATLPDCEVGAICDVDDAAIEGCMKQVTKLQPREPKTVKDFRRLLDDPSIDALVIGAPDHWHAPATILGCSAGKHVYVEKPACHNPREGELMVAAARKFNRVVQLGTQRRSSPGLPSAIQKLHDGAIGRVLFARTWITSTRPSIGFGKPAAVPGNLDYALWQGPAPAREYRDNIVHYHWHWFWHWGTGELGNNGIHALDVARWGMGVECPDKVVCAGGKYYFDDDQETPDTQLATFHFRDRAIHWEHRTWHKKGIDGTAWGVTFFGDKGSCVVGDAKAVFADRDEKPIEEISIGGNGERAHQQDFLDCIRTGEKPRAEIEIGVASTLLCHLGNIAYRSGRTVNLDPTARKIIGDAEQQSLWGREYEKGWEPVV